MKTPHIISFYIYAETKAEIEDAQRAAHDFVMFQYEQGKIVTAKKLAEALRKAQNTPFVGKTLTE